MKKVTERSSSSIENTKLKQNIEGSIKFFKFQAQTGTIMRYNGDKDGIIKTPKHGEIAFSMETVYLCKVHKLFCRDGQCPHYLPLKKWNSNDLAQLMPAGTMVSFYSRYAQEFLLLITALI